MKKVLLPILLAATIFASCSGGDERLKGFENKEFGEFVIKQEKLLNEMITAVEAKDSSKIKSVEDKMKSTDQEGEKFMSTASEADQKKAGEILEPVLKRYFEKMFGNIDDMNFSDPNPETTTDAPTAPQPEAPVQ